MNLRNTKYTVLTLIMFTLLSCTSDNDKYLNRYNRFASFIIENNETFTSLDWEAAVTEYEELRSEYRLYAQKLSIEDRQRIENINTKINALIIEHVATDAIDTFGGVMREILDTINELVQ